MVQCSDLARILCCSSIAAGSTILRIGIRTLSTDAPTGTWADQSVIHLTLAAPRRYRSDMSVWHVSTGACSCNWSAHDESDIWLHNFMRSLWLWCMIHCSILTTKYSPSPLLRVAAAAALTAIAVIVIDVYVQSSAASHRSCSCRAMISLPVSTRRCLSLIQRLRSVCLLSVSTTFASSHRQRHTGVVTPASSHSHWRYCIGMAVWLLS